MSSPMDEAPSPSQASLPLLPRTPPRIDPNLPYARPSIVVTSPESTQPILPTAATQAPYLARFFAPLESELLHQVTVLKTTLRPITTGPEFWKTLAKGLANLLGSQYVGISKRLDTIESNTGLPALDEEGSCIVALGWVHNCNDSKNIFEDIEYTGYCAPCGLMRHNSTALIPNGLMETFPSMPNKSAFAEAPDAYLGVPMFDAKGVNMGHISCLWTRDGLKACPYSWTMMEFVLHVFVEMATQRFMENMDAKFDKEESIAKAVLHSSNRNVPVPPSPVIDHSSSHIPGPHNSIFLPFPAAIAANISHEIRTPLTGIIGLLEILYSEVDSLQSDGSTSTHKWDQSPSMRAVLDGIQENSTRLMDFTDKLGEYYSLVAEAPSLGSSHKRKLPHEDTDEEILWATAGAQRKFLKRRKAGPFSTTEADDSSSDTRNERPEAAPTMRRNSVIIQQVSIRSTIRQIIKHVLTRHEVGSIWGGKKLGLMQHNPETRMRSVLLGEGDDSLLLEWKVAEDVPRWLDCSKTGLQKAITQLLVNAIKFTPSGRITFLVTRQKANLFPELDRTEVVRFSIKDTGIGVAEDYQQFLTQPFFQVDPSTTRSREGAGLGLMLAHRWALKAGGDLRLIRSETANEPNHGSEFALRLPISKYAPAPVLADADDSDDDYDGDSSSTTYDTPTKRKPNHVVMATNAYDRNLAAMYPFKIMIVEDNEILRKLMASLLQKLGYEPANLVLCSNGQEAVDYFCSRPPQDFDIDLILMDCWMPVMDGIDATRHILEMFPPAGPSSKKKYPGIKPDIVAITADALPANLERAQKAGMRGYMVKPIKLNDLQRVVEESAEGNWLMKKFNE